MTDAVQPIFDRLFDQAFSPQKALCACGLEIVQRRRTSPKRSCGRCLSKAYRSRLSDENRETQAKKAKARAKRKQDSAREALGILVCLQCSAVLTGRRRKFCSFECTQIHLVRSRTAAKTQAFGGEWPVKPCEECTIEFQAKPHSGRARRYCSASCGRKAALRSRTKRRHAAKSTLVVFDFSPNEIFWRDHWKCRVCGVATPAHLKGKRQPTSPEMDHIVPLSRGGDHTPENCRCLCKTCNAAKGAKLDEEWL